MNYSITTLPAQLPDDWESHLQILHRQFFESATDRCLLWVNPAQADPFAGHAFAEQRRVIVPIQHPRLDRQFTPYLLPLDLSKSADADLFKTSVQIAWENWTLPSLKLRNGQSIAGWVMTDSTPDTLAQHWATTCHLHRHNNLDKLLRFHDPGVREWLWPTLTPLQQRQILGPAKTVIAIDRQQALMYHPVDFTQKNRSNSTSIADNFLPSQKLILTTEQWQQIEDYATLHSAWLHCCIEQADFKEQLVKKSGWEQTIFAALQQATCYGIHDQQDRELFARHALQLGGNFHLNQKLQQVWKNTQTGEYYGSALEEVCGFTADQLHTNLNRTNEQ